MPDPLPLSANLLVFVAAAAAVWFAAVRLTRCADAIATVTGLSQEILGLLLLGAVTSLPELAVAVTATLQGSPALTIGDLLGSAALNVVLLALADATVRSRPLTSIQGSPKVMLVGVLGIVMMAVIVAPAITGDVLVLGIGGWSWAMLLVYAAAVWIMSHSQAEAAWQPLRRDAAVPEEGRAAALLQPGLAPLLWRAAAAAAVILVAGFLLARTGDALARQTGLGSTFFGMVFLACATSLPEASTVFAAVRLKRYAMAISDVLGTNLFNATIIVLVDALHPGPPVLLQAGRGASFGALLALLLTALFLIGLIERRDRTFAGLGIDSLFALLTYGTGLVVLYALA
ncbi:sodium:calcium antiporter [Ramlibacter sp. AN1133]|uniref:sodium:calcium antiporter n=1 Tax=Ramlibacter sp. AN1133 TaxID=3133429 RepID=UPI0030BB05AF